jgi:hypothetical protein
MLQILPYSLVFLPLGGEVSPYAHASLKKQKDSPNFMRRFSCSLNHRIKCESNCFFRAIMRYPLLRLLKSKTMTIQNGFKRHFFSARFAQIDLSAGALLGLDSCGVPL